MSNQEMMEEYLSDLISLNPQIIRFSESDYVRHLQHRRRKESQFVLSRHLAAAGGNRYVGLLSYRQTGVGKSKHWVFDVYYIGLIRQKDCDYVVIFYEDANQALVITPHFLYRYKERFSTSPLCDWRTRANLIRSKNIFEIASVYLERNLSVTWIETDVAFRGNVHIFAPIPDGVALLQWASGADVLQANTFVSFDMLSNKQINMVQQANLYLSMTEEERSRYATPDFVVKRKPNKPM